MTGPGNQLVLAGNPSRPGQEMLKNCIDKINNNGDVIPVTPCPAAFRIRRHRAHNSVEHS